MEQENKEKKSYWNVWYSNPQNREKKKQYAKDRYYANRENILANKRDRLSNETDEQRENRLSKMREYYYDKRDKDRE